jgi:hypothetical protein
MNQGTLNLIYIGVVIICLYFLKQMYSEKENFSTYSSSGNKSWNGKHSFGKSWFGSDRRFRANTWRYPYSFYNTYPRWFYNNYIEPAYSTDPVYLVTNSNINCKRGCFDKYNRQKKLTNKELESIKDCLEACK